MTDMEESSEARYQLDSVLSNLYDFGDDFVNSEDHIPEHGETNGLLEGKEAEKVNGKEEDQRPVLCSKKGKKNVTIFFDSIKDELCSQAKNPTMSSSSVSKPPSVDVVTFVSRKVKNQSNEKTIQDVNTEKSNETEDNCLEFNFEKARLEVHKFGITGYKKDIQRKFEQERAIMLGAKPPKRQYVNYKLYQEQLKEKNQVQKDKNVMENSLEPVRKIRKQGKNDRKSRKTKSSRTAPSGQVGRFRDGALILSGKDIEKIKKSKVIKG
ncbi:uncharacterized protein C1orf131 homolog [Hyla sarda]|uniref:uncharacterized protein C1orf131 homolog n=1 Tax=Hyla sarda TaxID=327740 RepID=UPI0024C39844|nr:uncharacterized protein C1orf131 homolog [Hyla sarda]